MLPHYRSVKHLLFNCLKVLDTAMNIGTTVADPGGGCMGCYCTPLGLDTESAISLLHWHDAAA